MTWFHMWNHRFQMWIIQFHIWSEPL